MKNTWIFAENLKLFAWLQERKTSILRSGLFAQGPNSSNQYERCRGKLREEVPAVLQRWRGSLDSLQTRKQNQGNIQRKISSSSTSTFTSTYSCLIPRKGSPSLAKQSREYYPLPFMKNMFTWFFNTRTCWQHWKVAGRDQWFIIAHVDFYNPRFLVFTLLA